MEYPRGRLCSRPPIRIVKNENDKNARRPDLSVRLALRVDDALELAEDVHAGQQLRQARIRLALLLDRGDELAILKLDAVHRNVDLRQVDLVVLAVDQIVVIGLVGAVVADVAEERAD